MNPGGAAISLTYVAADRVIPGGCLLMPACCTACCCCRRVAAAAELAALLPRPALPCSRCARLTAQRTPPTHPPGYGGGMSSAKAALESDTKVLAYEAGRK